MAVTRVNTSSLYTTAIATTIDSAATSLTAGNRILVLVRAAFATISGVSDTAGNTYALIRGVNSATTRMELWQANNVAGNGSNVVTVTFTASVQFIGLLTAQYAGSDSYVLSIDGTGTGTGNTITPDFDFTVGDPDALVITGSQIEATGETWTPATGLTSAVQDASSVQMIAEGILTAATAITPSVTSSGSASKCVAVAVFIAPSGGGGGGEHASVFCG